MIDALSNPPLGVSASAAARPASAESFTQALARKSSRLTAANAAEAGTKAERLREVSGQLVATAFLLPLFKQARSSAFKTDLFGGGFAQDAMQEKLDVHLAEAIAASHRFPLTDAVVNHLDQTA
ncbi:MAG: hypothetical protein AAGE65_04865 [Planctomycetota bacterium]